MQQLLGDINLLDKFLSWAMPLILSGILGFMIMIVKYIIAMKKSTVAMLRSQIVSKCEHYLKLGYLPEYARYCLEDLFEQYKAFKGNHGIDVLVDQCFELPLTEQKKSKGGK